MRLRSAAPRRQQGNIQHIRLGQAVQEARIHEESFRNLRFREREAFRRHWTKLSLHGSVGAQFNRLLPPNCSSCDERARPEILPEIGRYANKWLKKRNIKAPSEAARPAARRSTRQASRLQAVGEAHVVKKNVPVKEKSSDTETCVGEPGSGAGPLVGPYEDGSRCTGDDGQV